MAETSTGPDRPKLVLGALILVAAVANLNLAVANVALPDIGKAFDAGQTALNLVAVGYSLGLAASVLYLGAVGDRYGRKLLLLIGTGLAIPASLLRRSVPAVLEADHRRGAQPVPRRRPVGLPGAILLGALIVRVRFPSKDDEARLHAEYDGEDAAGRGAEPARAGQPVDPRPLGIARRRAPITPSG